MKARILLVDDEPYILEGLQRGLDRKLFNVSVANDADEALQLLEQENYDVVVSDEQMPGLTGGALLTYVRTKWPQTVRIMLTGKGNVHSAIKAVAEGRVFKFLEKPCPAELLNRVLREGLLRRQLVSHAGPGETGMPIHEARRLLKDIAGRKR